MEYYERKKVRTEWYKKYIFGNKLKTCVSCNGSGYYDGTFKGKQLKCQSCLGVGKVRTIEIIPLCFFS